MLLLALLLAAFWITAEPYQSAAAVSTFPRTLGGDVTVRLLDGFDDLQIRLTGLRLNRESVEVEECVYVLRHGEWRLTGKSLDPTSIRYAGSGRFSAANGGSGRLTIRRIPGTCLLELQLPRIEVVSPGAVRTVSYVERLGGRVVRETGRLVYDLERSTPDDFGVLQGTGVLRAAGPLGPGDLRAATAGARAIALQWSDGSDDEDGFAVERKANGSAAFARVATVARDITSYTDTGLVANARYVYRIAAFHDEGASAPSNEAAAKTLPDPPPAPHSVVASAVSSSQLVVTWQGGTGAEAFRIERQIGVGAFFPISRTGAGVMRFVDVNRAPSVVHTYRIRASNAGGDSAYSTTASAVTHPAILALQISPSALRGGAKARGIVTLTGEAPAGVRPVVVLSTNMAALRVPASLEIPSGERSRAFPILSSHVKGTTVVTVTATYAGSTRSASLTLKK